MTHEEMMGMLATKNPCANGPPMIFDPDNPTELAQGEEATLDVIGGLPPYTFEILQTSLYFIDQTEIAWPPGYSDTYVKATSKLGTEYQPWYAADPTLSRIGGMVNTNWVSQNGANTEQRWNIDLGTTKVIKQIMLENFHHEAGTVNLGIKNFILQGSNNANALNQLDYSSDQYWTNIAAELQAAEHSALNFDDPQFFNLTNDSSYRYYSLKIADNWTFASYMGLRHVQFHTAQDKVYKFVTNNPQVTITAPAFALWTCRIRVIDLCETQDNAFLWTTDGKWDMQESGTTGGTPSPCGLPTFRRIKNGVMFYGEVCNESGHGFSGLVELDCGAYGGGSYEINLGLVCGGGPGCTHVKTLNRLCWPFP